MTRCLAHAVVGPMRHARTFGRNLARPFLPARATAEDGDGPAGDGVLYISTAVLSAAMHRDEQITGLHISGVQLHLANCELSCTG